MKPALVTLKFAALPLIVVAYIAGMGLTGTCATCESMVDWTLGRSAVADSDGTKVVAATNASGGETAAGAAGSSGPVHQLRLPDLEGGAVSLAEFAGRPMLIEVWATWCGPCRRLRNVLTDAAPRLAEHATLVAVSVDKGGAPTVNRHLGQKETPFVELLSTPEFRMVLAPHNPGNTIPKLVYVDASGRVAGIELGVADPSWVEARLKALR